MYGSNNINDDNSWTKIQYVDYIYNEGVVKIDNSNGQYETKYKVNNAGNGYFWLEPLCLNGYGIELRK